MPCGKRGDRLVGRIVEGREAHLEAVPRRVCGRQSERATLAVNCGHDSAAAERSGGRQGHGARAASQVEDLLTAGGVKRRRSRPVRRVPRPQVEDRERRRDASAAADIAAGPAAANAAATTTTTPIPIAIAIAAASVSPHLAALCAVAAPPQQPTCSQAEP